MGEVVNLRGVRKAKARAEAEARAEANRAKFGRSKAAKGAAEQAKAEAKRRLDAHRREPGADEPRAMTRPVKRSFTIKGHRTSISIEAAFWDALLEAAAAQRTTLAALIAGIDAHRASAGLSSAVRVWVLDYYRNRAQASQPDNARPERAAH